MNRFIPLILMAVSFNTAVAQLSTTEFRDAASCGPYPVYIGVGWGQSWQYNDLERISEAFLSNESMRHRIRGVNTMLGVSLIPKGSTVSYFLEADFHAYGRTMKNDAGRFNLTIRQFSFGGGMRYVFAPLIVVQAQLGSIFLHQRNYQYKTSQTTLLIPIKQDSKPFNEFTAKVRIGLLDPAGTEGGIGFYVEAGYNWLNKSGREQEIRDAIRLFDPEFDISMDSGRQYGYLSFGILIPVALRF